MKEDWDFVDQVSEIFEAKGATVYFVELEAELKERLERSKSPHRLQHKPTKRNIELKETMKNHRVNSNPGEIKNENYIKINNTDLEATEVVEIITEKFKL